MTGTPIGEVIGMANSWFQEGMAAARTVRITAELEIKVFPAAFWLAAKISAFKDRGGSCYESKDLEDILALVDGRPGLLQEIALLQEEPRHYVRAWFHEVVRRDDINDIVAGLMPRSGGRGRERVLLTRMRALAGDAVE